jgi:hypothetical protein
MVYRSLRLGFSLMELMLSIGIIGTSLILVVGIFTMLFSGSQKAGDLTAGSVVADGLLTQQIYQLTSVESTRTAFFQAAYTNPTFFRGGTYSLNNTVYFYKIYVQDIDPHITLHDTDTDGTAGSTKMKRLDVVVWWNDASAASQTSAQNMTMHQQARNMGNQEVHQMRILWPTTGDSGQ